jgi:uncharacterized membrane protein YdjX (TVP38/TMEM64 family)
LIFQTKRRSDFRPALFVEWKRGDGQFPGMRLVWLFVGLALIFLLSWMIWGGVWDERFTLGGTIAWLEGSGRWAWAAGMGMLVADLVLPLPGTIVMSALGFVYGSWLGGLFAFTGQMLASTVGYGCGRLCGEGFVRRWLGDEDFERGRKLFGNGGGWIVAFSRTLPILPEVVSCMAGISRMPFGSFLMASVCGNLTMAFIFSFIGAAGKDAPWWAIAASLVVPGVLWLAAVRWNRGKD